MRASNQIASTIAVAAFAAIASVGIMLYELSLYRTAESETSVANHVTEKISQTQSILAGLSTAENHLRLRNLAIAAKQIEDIQRVSEARGWNSLVRSAAASADAIEALRQASGRALPESIFGLHQTQVNLQIARLVADASSIIGSLRDKQRHSWNLVIWVTIALAGIFLFVVILQGVLIYLASVRPVLAATSFASEVARGDFGQRLKMSSSISEVQELIDSLDWMAESLQERTQKAQQAEASRRLAESELEQQQALTRFAGEIGGIGGWRYEKGADHVEWTDETARLHDLPPRTQPTVDEAIGYYIPKHRPRIEALLTRCLNDGESFDGEFRIVTVTGREIRVRSIGEPDYDGAGKIVAARGAVQDITELVTTKERLFSSQKLEAIGQLTGGVAHDFNNHLTVILGNAELLSEQLEGSPKLHKLAQGIEYGAERAAQLTSRLLSFARQQPLDPRAIKADELVKGTEPLLRRTLPENIDVEIVGYSGLWPATVDPGELENALLNLCLNARDAMPGGGKLTIEFANVHLDDHYSKSHAEVSPGQYVRISVSDNGIGMPPEMQERIFEPFFTTKREGKGTGLGLSMAFGFAKQSKGHLTVYSEVGQGSTFRLYLPRATSDVGRPESKEESDHLPTGSERILLVEDNAIVREHLVMQVRSLGYEVLEAADGPQALKIVEESKDIDMILSDVMLPGNMNGRELVEAATRLRPRVISLFMSGYTENAIVHHGRLDHDVEFISKPFRLKDLAVKIRRVLDKDRN